MAAVRFAARARRDLAEIGDYIARDNYLIIYDVVGSDVTIRFIVHGARNLDALV